MPQTTGSDETAVDELEDHVRGELHLPGDGGYEEARTVWTAMAERYPSYGADANVYTVSRPDHLCVNDVQLVPTDHQRSE